MSNEAFFSLHLSRNSLRRAPRSMWGGGGDHVGSGTTFCQVLSSLISDDRLPQIAVAAPSGGGRAVRTISPVLNASRHHCERCLRAVSTLLLPMAVRDSPAPCPVA